jgi:hypothetical protein
MPGARLEVQACLLQPRQAAALLSRYGDWLSPNWL